MTGREFSEVDFDLLADYVGGALDGTPEEAAVARRVAEEPAWAEAYSALSEATGSVRASLVAWGESAEPMPAEVAERIATALAQQHERPALRVVPDDADGPRRRVTGARRRLPAWAAPAAIAAGVTALAGLGLSQLGGVGDSDDGGSGTLADAPAMAPGNAEARRDAAEAAGWSVTTSGRDYQSATLASAADTLFGGRVTAQEARPGSTDLRDIPELLRLRDPAALADCVDAIGREHPPGVTAVEVVDLASFEGAPAAVVFFTDGSGARWAWASGPDCGLAARGADTRGSAKIG